MYLITYYIYIFLFSNVLIVKSVVEIRGIIIE